MFSSIVNFPENKQLKKIKIGLIEKNPAQPRKYFDNISLEELAQSIREYGVLNPITVRKNGTRYEIIAGERRLRASKIAGMLDIPCIIMTANDKDSSLIAIIENIQRQDLDFFEEAISYKKLIENFSFTQEEAAKKLGKTQSSVANKLRLLKLSTANIDLIKMGNLTERHARAILKLPTEEIRMMATSYIIQNGLNVSKSDEYIENLSNPIEIKTMKKTSPLTFIKDVRFFLNTVNKSLKTMQSSGLDIISTQEETDDGITIHITIPHAKKKMA